MNIIKQNKIIKIISDLYPPIIGSCLDYGCNDGKFIENILKSKKFDELFGIDVSKEDIERAREKRLDAKFLLIEPNSVLDFPDNYFDIVSMYQVLEHVGDEPFVLEQMYRILRPGGMFIVSVPHKGIFAWADTNNFKYNFPYIHSILYRVFNKMGKDEYNEKFGYNDESQMVGNLTISKSSEPFHKHYSLKDIKKFFGNTFRIELVYYYNCFFPILSWSRYLFGKTPYVKHVLKYFIPLLEKLITIDNNMSFGRFSYHILVKAVKV